MNAGITPRIAARLSLGLAVAFLALLTALHVLEPGFNWGHLISEYQLGDYGFLMSLAFLLLGASAFLLALSLRPRLHTRGGCVGRSGLLVIGAAYFVAGVFPPVRTPVVSGYLHGISGLVVIFGSPIAFTLIIRSLARSQTQGPLSYRLRLATLVAWGGLFLFVVSLISINLTEGVNMALPSWVSLANRVMIATYCIWLMIAAQSATWKQPSPPQRSGGNV